MTEPIIALDLFAGAGGWDIAAHSLGVLPHGVENMPEAIASPPLLARAILAELLSDKT